MNSNAVIFTLVQDFISCVGQMVALLKEDSEYFKQNNLAFIEQSNSKKLEVNSRLGEVVIKLQSVPELRLYSGNLYEKISQYASSLELVDKESLEKLLSIMQDEGIVYHQLMLVNRHVISTNVAYIRELFSAMFNNENNHSSEFTYGSSGVLEKS